MFESPEQEDSHRIQATQQNVGASTAPLAGNRMPAPPPTHLPGHSPQSPAVQQPHSAPPATGYQPDAVPAALPGGFSPRRWRRFLGPQSHNNKTAIQSRVSPPPSVPTLASPYEHRLPDDIPSPLPSHKAQLGYHQSTMVSTPQYDAHPTRLPRVGGGAPHSRRWLLLTLALPLLMLVGLLVLASIHFAWLNQHGQYGLSSQTSPTHTPTILPTANPSPQNFTDTTQGYTLRYPGLWTVYGHPGDRELSGDVTSPTGQYSQIAVFQIQVWPTNARLPDGSQVSDANLLDDFMYPQLQIQGSISTTENTVSYAGSQWLRQQITVSGTNQSFREIGLLGHHHAQIYILIYYVNQGEWPPAAVQGFTLILSSFHFTS